VESGIINLIYGCSQMKKYRIIFECCNEDYNDKISSTVVMEGVITKPQDLFGLGFSHQEQISRFFDTFCGNLYAMLISELNPKKLYRIASFKNLTIENCCLIFKSY
jgi:hypothetical protein